MRPAARAHIRSPIRAAFSNPFTGECQKERPIRMDGPFFLAAGEGFEPSKRLRALRALIEISVRVQITASGIKKAICPKGQIAFLAAGEGFEPSQTESESGVLPLHKPATRKEYYTEFQKFVKNIFAPPQIFFSRIRQNRRAQYLLFPRKMLLSCKLTYTMQKVRRKNEKISEGIP